MRFPPKAASGLSQASIFGASLGGILVNIRKHHPDEYIRDTKGTPLEDCPGKIVSYEKDKGPGEIEEDRRRYLEGGDSQRRFYTRPVVDYDMALFLAPMEMAGAVLGKLIQAILPNWLYLMIASIILGFTSYKTYKKFFATRAKEKEEVANNGFALVERIISCAVRDLFRSQCFLPNDKHRLGVTMSYLDIYIKKAIDMVDGGLGLAAIMAL